MFTGSIESQAVLKSKKNSSREVRLTFEGRGEDSPFRLGESVAIDGACTTISTFHGPNFSVDLIPETRVATTLGRLKVGQKVNLERALRVGDRLGGHWVTGHVDGLGKIRRIKRHGRSFHLQIEASTDIIRHLVAKGSIAIDGISFTLQKIEKGFFTVGVTPHTFRATTLQWKKAGDPVNLEIDLLAKLVRHFLSSKK